MPRDSHLLEARLEWLLNPVFELSVYRFGSYFGDTTLHCMSNVPIILWGHMV